MADITGFLDNLQRFVPEDSIAIGCEECANAALAQAKSHISLIHIGSSFINAENQPVELML